MSKHLKEGAELDLSDDPPLTAAALVCTRHFATFPIVASTISAFTSSILTSWTLETASRSGFFRLLDRIGKNEWADVNQHFRQKRLDHAISDFFDHSSKATVDTLEWWLTQYSPEQYDASVGCLFQHAVSKSRLDVIQWLHAHDKLVLNDTVTKDDVDVFCSSPEIAYWLHKYADGFGLKLSLSCCTEGNFPFLQWAIKHRDRYEVRDYEYVVDEMCYNGMLDELKWLDKHGSACFSKVALERAILNDQVEVAKWLYSFPKKRNSDPCRGCSEFATVNWVVQNYHWQIPMARVYFFESATLSAVYKNDLRALKLAFKNRVGMVGNPMGSLMGSPMEMMGNPLGMISDENDVPIVYRGDRAMSAAAGSGNLEMVQWLLKHGAEQEDAMNRAAGENHLDMIKWMHENDIKNCTTYAMDGAATGNHLAIVQWLHEHRSEGCTPAAMDRAAAKGHLDVVQWLHEHRSEGCTIGAMDNAADNGHLEMVKWLHENRSEGCTTNAMDRAAANGNLEMVTWLHENRTEGCTKSAMDSACANGQWEIAQFLHKHRQEGCTEKALNGAAKNGYLEIVKWLCYVCSSLCTEEALIASAMNGKHKVVEYLSQHHDLVLGTDALEKVANEGHFGIVEWLLKHNQLLGKLGEENPYVDEISGI